MIINLFHKSRWQLYLDLVWYQNRQYPVLVDCPYYLILTQGHNSSDSLWSRSIIAQIYVNLKKKRFYTKESLRSIKFSWLAKIPIPWIEKRVNYLSCIKGGFERLSQCCTKCAICFSITKSLLWKQSFDLNIYYLYFLLIRFFLFV